MAPTRIEPEHEEVPVLMAAEHAYTRVVAAVAAVGRVTESDHDTYRLTGRVRAGGMRPATVTALVTPDGEDTSVLRVEAFGGSAAEAITRILDAF